MRSRIGRSQVTAHTGLRQYVLLADCARPALRNKPVLHRLIDSAPACRLGGDSAVLGAWPERDGAQVARQVRHAGEKWDVIIGEVERRRLLPKDAQMDTLHYNGKKTGYFDKNAVINTHST